MEFEFNQSSMNYGTSISNGDKSSLKVIGGYAQQSEFQHVVSNVQHKYC